MAIILEYGPFPRSINCRMLCLTLCYSLLLNVSLELEYLSLLRCFTSPFDRYLGEFGALSVLGLPASREQLIAYPFQGENVGFNRQLPLTRMVAMYNIASHPTFFRVAERLCERT